jgi:hypothetical protein
VQADLLFKKHTGVQRNKLPPSQENLSSFNGHKEMARKEQLQGLNRMDYETFLLSLSDIANTVHLKWSDENGVKKVRDESQAFQALIRINLWMLDESLQQTEQGNNS